MKTTDSQLDGFEVIELANDAVRIAVMPALGAKVISLRYLPTGRERMWSRPRQPQFSRTAAGHAVRQGRWSERTSVCRRLRPCASARLSLPDHGEAWSESWELDRTALAAGRIRTRLRLPISPLFDRA